MPREEPGKRGAEDHGIAVRRVVGVRVAVGIHVAEVRGIAGVREPQPPVDSTIHRAQPVSFIPEGIYIFSGLNP